ncbi:MAG: UvrD-helicase domain-containing protein [Pedobacter sp.]|uniref:UvrD-helicase domain-containing protein n=1 Tax=Pedobacter sp. TaxID=1411316 RepID=UPI0028081FAF|nr:UvrD-helicase domain-containing protein [Pedobacter sp.]MDQ8003905.1 UvrD-helicase domain-containing protein [Pedobacter sp.]
MAVKPLKILQASAGSGKTFSLAAHYLTLLFSGENKYREILAVTFTNKATEEMKTRILEVLKGFAIGDASRKIEDYRMIVLAAHPDLNTETLKFKADKVYRKILHDYSRFAVSTIDGFVQKVIRGFAFELGLNADYTLEMNYDKVKDELVQKLDESLNHNQQLLQWIIDLALERIGDNKSWNYKSELINLINEVFKDSYEVFETAVNTLGLDSLDELFKKYISVTKAEINHFQDRLKELGAAAWQIFENHGVTADQLKGKSRNGLLKVLNVSNGDFSKLDTVFKLIDEPEEWFQKGVDLPAFYSELNKQMKTIKAFHEQNLATYSLSIAFNKNLYYLRLMQEVAVLLSDYRNENDNLLISDAQKLITGITDDAGENPSFIWEKVGSKYRNFLFDEFQDTSVNQWKSFRSILSNAIATPSQKHIDNLIVGDTKQSIYRWRNGDWNILHQQAKHEIGEHNVFDDNLEENYRSTENIITFNNYLYQSLPVVVQQQLNNNVTEKSDELLEWWDENGYSDIVTSVYEKAKQNPSPFTKLGGTIKIKRFGKADVPEERADERFSETMYREIALQDVIEEIKILKTEKKYQAKDIAILVRSNFEAMLCVTRLMEQNIPVLSGEALMVANNSAVELIINTLKVLVGIDKQTALYKANCISLYHRLHQREIEPTAYLGLTGQSLTHLSALLPKSLCENWQNWMQLPLIELVENLIEAYGITKLKQHIPYLLAFRDLIANATRMGEKGIVNFLTWWDEDGVKKSLPSPDEADAVQIITIHKSKGLAFRAVFVPFCNWDLKTKANSIFWVSAAETAYKELGGIPLKFAEELSNSTVAKAYYKELLDSNLDALNMLYVATTRSKDYLYVSVMEKKDASVITSVGDALAQVVSQINLAEEEDFDATNRYEIIDDVLEVKAGESNGFELESYPTTNRLSALYVPSQEKHLQHVLNIEHSGRIGSIKHEVLANATNEAEVEDCLTEMLLSGAIAEDEFEDLKNGVMEVLNHPELKSILAQSTESIIEKNIIDANGKLHRPDRIVVHADSVTIIDYKFTLEQTDKHIEQILNYKDLLTQMGFEKVKSYLFYAVKQELKEV